MSENPLEYRRSVQLRQYITPFENIIKDIEEVIYPFLAEPISEEPSIIESRGSILQAHIATLVKYLADSKYYLDQKIQVVVPDNKGKVAQPVMRIYCESLCEDENYLHNLIGGLLDKCYKENDWNRTLLSKAKEEYRINNQR